MSTNLLHATGVAIEGNGVLLLGPSGSGKSDLALRLIDRGAMLVSDDAVRVNTSGILPVISAAPNIESKLEIRGIGICFVAYVSSAPLRLVVEFSDEVERMPISGMTTSISGFAIPMVKIVPFEISAAVKLEYALRSVVDAGLWPVSLVDVTISESRTN